MSWTTRCATIVDAQRICDMNRSALGYASELASVEMQLQRISIRVTDRVWVVHNPANGVVAGFIHAADYETIHAGSLKNIIALAVDESYRGLGLGRLLVEAVEQWAKVDGCAGIRLVSSASRVKAHAFYLHCGYTLRKEQMNFIKYL